MRALQLLPEQPAAALAACGDLGPSVRGECVLAAVEVAPTLDGLEAWCDSVPEGTTRSECWFQIAEGRGDLGACARAAPFADDCRLHVWTSRLPSVWSRSAPLDEGVTAARAELISAGLDAGDSRFWSAAFRYALASSPLDRLPCRDLEPTLRDACWNTGIAVLNDRINRVRDFHEVDCAAADFPPTLAINGPDPELESLRSSRWTEEICPPSPGKPDSDKAMERP